MRCTAFCRTELATSATADLDLENVVGVRLKLMAITSNSAASARRGVHKCNRHALPTRQAAR